MATHETTASAFALPAVSASRILRSRLIGFLLAVAAFSALASLFAMASLLAACPPALSPLGGLAYLTASPAFAQSPATANAGWIENPGLVACFEKGASAGQAKPKSPSSSTSAPSNAIFGEVFDSSDYQSMLVLPAEGEFAYIVQLATKRATAYPRAAFLDAAGHVQASPSSGETSGSGIDAGAVSTDDEGRMTFHHAGGDIQIEPAPPVIGAIERADLEARQPVYARHARAYRPDAAAVAALAAHKEPVEILAFFGTWCSTCKTVLPGLLASLDAAANPALTLTCVGVDEELKQPEDMIGEFDVKGTPTIIVLISGMEIGRIVDEPRKSVEADLAAILVRASGGSR